MKNQGMLDLWPQGAKAAKQSELLTQSTPLSGVKRGSATRAQEKRDRHADYDTHPHCGPGILP